MQKTSKGTSGQAHDSKMSNNTIKDPLNPQTFRPESYFSVQHTMTKEEKLIKN